MSAPIIRCLIAIAVVLEPGELAAQVGKVRSGNRVRITTITAPGIQPERLVGTVSAIRGDTIVLKMAALVGFLTQAVSVRSLERIELSVAQRRHTQEGAGIGAAAGLLVGLLATLGAEDDPSNQWFGFSAGEKRGLAAVGGVLLGGLVGTVIGALTTSDTWREVPLERLQLNLVPQRGGAGLALAASVSF